jgi:hypothetical protein
VARFDVAPLPGTFALEPGIVPGSVSVGVDGVPCASAAPVVDGGHVRIDAAKCGLDSATRVTFNYRVTPAAGSTTAARK